MRWLLVCSAWLLSSVTFAQNPVNPHLAFVPSNSVFHYQARIKDLEAMSLATLPQYQQSIVAQLDEPFAIMPILAMVDALQQQIAEDMAVTGIEQDGWLTFYPVGSTFMLRLDVSVAERTLAWVKRTLQEKDLAVRAESVAEGSWWELVLTTDEPGSRALIALTDQHLVFAMTPATVDESTVLARLWGESVAPSLATADTIAELQAQHGFLASQLGWVDVVEVVRTFVSVEPTMYAQEWRRDAVADLGTPSTVCEAEWLSLAAQSPRIVMGMTQFNVSADTIDSVGNVLFELNNTTLQQEISRLQGSLPNDLMTPGRSLFSMGMGVNMDTFSPVVVSWWQRVAQQQWDCPALQELQGEVSAMNPTTLAVATAIMQGAQSLVVEMFALGEQDDSAGILNQLGDIDALLAVKTRDPFLLAAILGQNIPFLKGVVIPATGEAVTLPVPFPGLRLQARVAGDYLVVYQGPKASARAAELSGVPHSPAFIRAAVDAAPVLAQFERQLIDWMPPGSMTAESCESLRSSMDELSRFEEVVGGLEVRMAEQGMQWQQRAQVRRGSQAVSGPVAGTYELAILEDDCRWSPIGIERLNADQSASYQEPDRFVNSTCNLYETRYEWRVTGNALIWANSESRSRNSCNETFAAWEADAEDSHCELLRQYANGVFECQVVFDGVPERFRYTPMRSE